MGKLLVFGGKWKEELLQERQAAAMKYYERRKEQGVKVHCDNPDCRSENFRCLKCGKEFDFDEPAPDITLQNLCAEVANYMITPLVNYKRQRRDAKEQMEILLLVKDLQQFQEPENAMVKLNETGYDKLRDLWTRFGKKDETDFDIEVPAGGPMGGSKTVKGGWGHLGEESSIAWLAARKIVMEASDEE